MNVLVFDIETIPDIDLGARLYELQGLSENDVAKAMFAKRRAQTGSEFLPHYMHRVVAISIVLKSKSQFKVWSLGDESSSEEELIRRFFDGIDRFQPTLVSWNGGGFDLPVLHYRALIHGVDAQRYWDTGDLDREFRWNNYLNRFHARHTDLMDVLSGYQARAVAPLNQVAVMLGFPGKLGMSGSAVWPAYLDGRLGDIRDYCETDVLNTYLVYRRWEVTRGNLDKEGFNAECDAIREYLAAENKPHFKRFLEAWASS
ncbi:MAG: 3'-5' exonuclease [Proteobacteria bacterium]|nr:MAG: 3'-5' exonuclease [Pseudomonadota bacterium]